MGGNEYLLPLVGAAGTALLAILYWILRRTDRALERSNSAIKQTNRNIQFTGENMSLVAALRSAIYLQDNSLGQWEDWGGDVRRLWRRMQQDLLEHGAISEITELPAPPAHLDLGPVFGALPKFGAGSASGAEDSDESTAGQDRSFMDRFLMRPPG